MNRAIKNYLESFLPQKESLNTAGKFSLRNLSVKYDRILKCGGIPYDFTSLLSEFATEFDVSIENIVTGGDGKFTRFEESVSEDPYCKIIVSDVAPFRLQEIKTLGYVREAAIPMYPYDTSPSKRYPYKYCLPDEFFETVAGDDRVSEDTFDVLLQPSVSNQVDGVWYTGFPYMIHWCYMFGNKEKLEKLLSATEKNNADAVQKRDDLIKRQGSRASTIAFRLSDKFGVVRVLGPTILVAFERGDCDIAQRMIEINKHVQKICNIYDTTTDLRYNSHLYIPTEREIELAKIRGSKTMSQTDKVVSSCLYNGVLKVQDLLAKTSDYNIVKDAMDKYPISERDLLGRMIEKKDWRGLFQYGFNFTKQYSKEPEDNILAMAIDENGDGYMREYSTWAYSSSRGSKRDYNYPSNFSGEPDAYRQKVLNELTLKNKLSETTDSLTPEYFEKQLSMGNYDMVIIKLCVRLESILKYKFSLEGDFSEMLDAYCKKFNGGDTPRLLNRLRLCRNAIVHPDQTSETMNIDELRKCVNYICNLG